MKETFLPSGFACFKCQNENGKPVEIISFAAFGRTETHGKKSMDANYIYQKT